MMAILSQSAMPPRTAHSTASGDRASAQPRQRLCRADIVGAGEPDVEHALERGQPRQPAAIGTELAW